MTTCRARGSGALRRPVFSPLDCSVLSWRPIHPGQLEPTTLPLCRLAPVSCSVGISPTLSLPFSLALSCSLSPVAPLCSFPTVLNPLSLSFSLSLPLTHKRGFGSFGASLSPPGFEPSSTGQKRCGVSTGPRRLGICTMRSNLLSCVSPPVMRIFFRMGVCSAACRGTAQRPRAPGPPA